MAPSTSTTPFNMAGSADKNLIRKEFRPLLFEGRNKKYRDLLKKLKERLANANAAPDPGTAPSRPQ